MVPAASPLYNFGLLGRNSKALKGSAMAELEHSLDSAIGQNIDVALQRLRNFENPTLDLMPVLDIAIRLTGAEMGTIQRFDETADCLYLVASRGFSREAVSFFGIVRRDTNTTCAAAFTRRMRVFVENVSTSYLFVGTSELDMLTANGVAAAQSTPLISRNGQFLGVISTHFQKTQIERAFDHVPLDHLAAQIANSLEHLSGLLLNSISTEDQLGKPR
ncbi:GAF domain-containing protein [Agrobacterium rubi]|uniref:GAF domain-containing protein n=1 Tax=Agrobacterium rubi TaxID=28099 RepID=A0AAE7R5V7_9HYPH|nr:GAF domain-containing protein [Agrobacterium rubi]NTE87782.1 GAF domain-containing protein [Agrobacterium rubi]NTF05219.1 GAF domain-containing protein [Agrobacterium rubi]NTF37876.1 GAF domain-containing protein [Agrobacterium rubi]OCJ54129.1 hypothetical protein A6U92_22635 [Agrobacterium rubi]QTG01739.1 GAF domain-containing protein [Agrobacterium rubi]